MEAEFSRHRQSEGGPRNAGAEPSVTLTVVSIAGPGQTMLDPCQARMGLGTAESHSQHCDLLEPKSKAILCEAICCGQGKPWLL